MILFYILLYIFMWCWSIRLDGSSTIYWSVFLTSLFSRCFCSYYCCCCCYCCLLLMMMMTNMFILFLFSSNEISVKTKRIDSFLQMFVHNLSRFFFLFFLFVLIVFCIHVLNFEKKLLKKYCFVIDLIWFFFSSFYFRIFSLSF